MVIVGTDFSPAAASAVRKARTLAKRLNEDLEIVHVCQSGSPDPWSPDAAEEEWLAAIGEPVARITIRRGTPWVELVRIAEEREAFAIVVGTHGLTGFHTIALGATAARLALISPRPTLLVGESSGGSALLRYVPPVGRNGKRSAE
jgi:nucleotide-binding universal stress UspA family protein